MRSIAAVLVAVALVSCGSEGSAGFGRRGVEIVEAMADGRFAEVREALHARISRTLTEDRLREAWGDFVDEHGEITEIGRPEVQEGNGTLVTIALDMSKRDGEAQVRFLPSGEVVGLDFGDAET